MGLFNELRGAVKAVDPIGAKVFDRALKNDSLSVKAGSHGIQWLGNALGWDGLESFGHHWAQMASADTKDPNRQLKNAALTAAVIYGGMSAAGAGGGTAGGTAGAGGTAAGAETGASVALGEAGGYGAAASAETAGTATALGEAGGYGAATTSATTTGVSQYATVQNAQKLYSGLQLAQALSASGAPKAPGAAPPPKASQVPGLQNARGNLGGPGGAPGVASTFLTGTAGVDPSLLNLGRSTLLGG